MMVWSHLIVSLLGGGILLGLGLTRGRSVSPASGWLFALGGVLISLSSCCTTAVFLLGSAESLQGVGPDPAVAAAASTVLGSGADLLATLVVASAFVVLARARVATGLEPGTPEGGTAATLGS